MKSLVMIGLVAMSSIALANPGGGGNHGGGGGGGGGPTSQTTITVHTSTMNTSDGMGSASEQNFATKLSARDILLFRTIAAMVVMRRKIWPPTRVALVCTPRHINSLFLIIQVQLTVQQMELRQYKISPRIPTALPA